MNMRLYTNMFRKLHYKLIYYSRLFDRKSKATSFANDNEKNTINRIYVINLDRKNDRWKQVSRELKRILGCSGFSLFDMTRRFSAIDARYLIEKIDGKILFPYYSLSDQLQVEPNAKVPTDSDYRFHCIKMTPQEIAIALSHIEVWKLIANSGISYSLVLEDDIYFQYGFARDLDVAWNNITNHAPLGKAFDILFLSYDEVGIPSKRKIKYTESVRKPDYGIWQASGYVLSETGAKKLLEMLPVYGPVDLWLNLIFDKLNVFLTKEPIIEQRFDIPSTNSYSIMPVLSQIGVHTREKPLITQKTKLVGPVFAFGVPNSGLTALAMALSVMGYTCCSDITKLPEQEQRNILTNRKKSHFNAYVNIGSLNNWSMEDINILYPNARFIHTILDSEKVSTLQNKIILYLPYDYLDKWELLCSFLKCEYPSSPYPICNDLGQQNIEKDSYQNRITHTYKQLKYDKSPWIIGSENWRGISIAKRGNYQSLKCKRALYWFGENTLNDIQWKSRDDTFPSNLSIFTPDNIIIDELGLMYLNLQEQASSVRSFSSAAIATQQKYLYGRFIVELKPSNVTGLVTGIFLHRNSPHQEIDIEFLGKDTTQMLVNVFYNPGIEGTKLEYGYRGTPILIDLGFDAAEDFHKYEIEWYSNVLRWSVDENIVCERVLWNPTPIPNLPMEFNVNLWYSRSEELAGKLDKTRIPTQSVIKSIHIENFD